MRQSASDSGSCCWLESPSQPARLQGLQTTSVRGRVTAGALASVMPIRGDSIRACAELFHQAGSVPDLPVVHALAVFEAFDGDTTERDALVGGRDAE